MVTLRITEQVLTTGTYYSASCLTCKRSVTFYSHSYENAVQAATDHVEGAHRHEPIIRYDSHPGATKMYLQTEVA